MVDRTRAAITHVGAWVRDAAARPLTIAPL